MCRLNRRSMSQRAGSIRRILATVIDLVIFLIAWWLISILVEPPLRARIQTEWRGALFVWLISPPPLLLFTRPEVVRATATGKRLLGRRIGRVCLDSAPASLCLHGSSAK